LFAGLMIVDMIIFWFMTYNYKYVGEEKEEDNEPPKVALSLSDTSSEHEGIDNAALETDENQKD
jgi:hypothetical protein